MRTLIFGAILVAVAAVGFHTLISASLAAARDAKAATFSNDLLRCLSPQRPINRSAGPKPRVPILVVDCRWKSASRSGT